MNCTLQDNPKNKKKCFRSYSRNPPLALSARIAFVVCNEEEDDEKELEERKRKKEEPEEEEEEREAKSEKPFAS